MKKQLVFAALLLAQVTGACSTSRDPNELFAPEGTGQLVIDALLIVGQAMPDVFLTRTLAPGTVVSIENAAVPDAQIIVRGGGNEVTYFADANVPIRYRPLQSVTVAPATTYSVSVTTPAGERLLSATTTPSLFRVNDWVLLNDDGTQVVRTLETYAAGDSIYDLNELTYSSGIVTAQFDRGTAPGFQVALFSLDPNSDRVIDPDFLDDEEFDRNTSSPPLEAVDGNIRLPWLAVYFEGRHKMKVFTMDRNWFDLARTDPTLGAGSFGFGGNAGDNFERPIFHVDGGIGLFGSAAVDSVGFRVLPRP